MNHSLPPNGKDGGRRRIVVAMSGGVDSSVAAALLVEQGHEVIGLMMRLWSEPSAGPDQGQNRCCTPDQMADARRVAEHLAIPFYVVDVQQFFFDTVVRYFIEEHEAGRTPNPCIECNRKVRFNHLLNRAMAMEADFLATGHYARVRRTKARYELLQARDVNKDQSYVLHVLGQKELGQVMFPIGDYTKSEVRQLAEQAGLPVAKKSESMDLCFLADGDYRRFLRERARQATNPGPVVNHEGDEIARHSGLVNYTIGQRKGLGFALGRPVYVLAKDSATNSLVVGDAEQLARPLLRVNKTNWIAGSRPLKPISVQVKIRYRAQAIPAVVTALNESEAEVRFSSPVIAVTAGQGAVFYDGQICLGGGIISDEGQG